MRHEIGSALRPTQQVVRRARGPHQQELLFRDHFKHKRRKAQQFRQIHDQQRLPQCESMGLAHGDKAH